MLGMKPIANIIFWVLIAGIVFAYIWLRSVGGIDPLDNKFFDWVWGFWDVEPPWLRDWSQILVGGLICGGIAYFAGSIYWKIVDAILGEKDEEYDDQPSNQVTAKNEKQPSGRIMNRNLINILIIIAILVGLYYVISPYQNCYRNYIADYKAKGFDITAKRKVTSMQECSYTKSW